MTRDEDLMQQAMAALLMYKPCVRKFGLKFEHGIQAITALRERLAQPSTCRWTQEELESDTWATNCGKWWIFNEGGPEDNGFRYCHGCGKPVEIDRAPEAKP